VSLSYEILKAMPIKKEILSKLARKYSSVLVIILVAVSVTSFMTKFTLEFVGKMYYVDY